MSTMQRNLASGFKRWRKHQGQIPGRVGLWITTTAMFLALLIIPLMVGDAADTATSFLLLGAVGVGYLWLRNCRKLLGRSGPIGSAWRVGFGVTLALITIIGFGSMFTAAARASSLLGIFGLIVNLIGFGVAAVLVVAVVLVIKKLAGSKSSASRLVLTPGSTATSIDDPALTQLLVVLNDPARLGQLFVNSGLAQVQKVERKPPARRGLGYSNLDLAVDAYGLGKHLFGRKAQSGLFVDPNGNQYRVPRLLGTQNSKAGLVAWFEILPGYTISNYRKGAEIMTTALGLPFGITVAQTDEDTRNRHMRLNFKLGNPLAGTVPFTIDPSTRIDPETPWVIGVDEDGVDVAYNIAAGAHMLIAGATRSGKSVCTYSLITHVLRMGDSVRLLVADPNDTTMAPFESKLSWSTNSTHPEAPTQMLRWVRSEMSRRRPILRAMRRDKIDKFTPELPMIVIIIDEAANYMRHGDKAAAAAFIDELMAVVAQGAKFGIRLVLITQRPDSTILPTTVRSQISARMSFRLEDLQTATMVFPDLDNPADLLTFDVGVGMYKEVAGQPRKFRSVFLEDHWAAAEQISGALPSVDVDDLGEHDAGEKEQKDDWAADIFAD